MFIEDVEDFFHAKALCGGVSISSLIRDWMI
jgi:hypothetical protein